MTSIRLALGVLFIAPLSLHAETNAYVHIIDKLYNEALVLKARNNELNSELALNKSSKLYFLPKLSLESKHRDGDNDVTLIESRALLSSLIYDDATPSRIEDADLKLVNAELNLLKEKNRLKLDTTQRLISISYYRDLVDKATLLKKSTQELLKKIKLKSNFGVARNGDLQQAELLVEKIDAEIQLLNRAIELAKIEINSSTGVNFTNEELSLSLQDVAFIGDMHAKYSRDEVTGNLDYKTLELASNIARLQIKQQNPLYSVSVIADKKYNNRDRVDNDSYVGLQLSLNLFDYSKIALGDSRESLYEAAKISLELKNKELQLQQERNAIEWNSIQNEILSVASQRDLTDEIIDSQSLAYDTGGVSLYEMLSTRFDLFTTEKKLTELNISKKINELSSIDIVGKL